MLKSPGSIQRQLDACTFFIRASFAGCSVGEGPSSRSSPARGLFLWLYVPSPTQA
jgi:hypothetical protein